MFTPRPASSVACQEPCSHTAMGKKGGSVGMPRDQAAKGLVPGMFGIVGPQADGEMPPSAPPSVPPSLPFAGGVDPASGFEPGGGLASSAGKEPASLDGEADVDEPPHPTASTRVAASHGSTGRTRR